ncbi:hypothetical protein HOY82DRAFT_538842 [Tuber indicum]|nr:hypothetical protein HOY82DRAFT_538842 [Tuber indicum]
MKSPFCVALLLFLQFVDLTRALPWDPPTCPLPAPQPPPAQRILQHSVDGSSTGNNTAPPVTKMLDRLLPRQTSTICQRVTCNSLYYCCNDQTCTYTSAQARWGCQWATRTLTVTSTYRSTSTSISTTTRTITTTTTVDTRTIWTFITSTGTWTTTDVVTSTATGTSYVTSSITLTRRGMPTPTRCVRRLEEEGRRGLAKRADPTIFITSTVTVTATPASTYYMTTTWLTTYWISRTWTTTRTSFIGVARTFTVTSTYRVTTAVTATAIETTTVSRKGMSTGAKVGAGVGGGVGGLAVVALLVVLIWKKCTKPTAEEAWAGNQPVEDPTVPPGNMGHGAAIVGVGGTLLAAGATEPYKAGYYPQNAGMASPPPAPPMTYVQPYQRPGQYLEGYPGLCPPTPPPTRMRFVER